jgi:wobble nucleotide-excising tRNase
MIQKIDIQSFGLFNEYEWKNHIGNDSSTDVFKKINIIYGRNYSGKTTLSRIFRWIETGNINEKYIGCRFNMIDDNGSTISEKYLTSPYKIRVYNSDFVKSHLSWLYDNENGEILPFTLVGSVNIIVANRIKAIDEELGNVEKQTGLYSKLEGQKNIYAEKEKSLNDKKEKIEQRLKEHANQKIKTEHYYILQGTNYNIANIKSEILEIEENPKNFLLTEKEISDNKIIIDEKEKNQINNELNIKKLDYQEYYSSVKLLVERKITLTETIQDLVTNSLLQKWVDEGRTHHRNKLERCAFCDELIKPERWKKLDAHFSKESEELKKSIEDEKLILEKSKKYIDDFIDVNKISKDNYYSLFHDEFEEIKGKWNNFVDEYSKLIDNLLQKLHERYDDIFNQKTINETTEITGNIEDIVESLNNLANKNNEKTKTIGEDKAKARKKLRYYEISRFITEINYFEEIRLLKCEEEKIIHLKNDIDDIKIKISSLEEEKKQEEIKKKDEGEAAKKVNSHLLNFFGHDALSLEPKEGDEGDKKTRFIVKRGNENAFHLSEGECSLLSFCYFIAKMEDELNSTDHNKLIIYIDDPVSSLDNNHIFFMFSLIENIITKDKKYRQLFISTHNLDFLKYIKHLTIPSKNGINHFIIEKRKKDTSYRCFLYRMPPHIKDYVTEYNFLFNEIYNMACKFKKDEKEKFLKDDFTLLYNLPNNMRRFLECYLFYRFPNTDKPLKNLGKIFDNNIPIWVNRVINEYSHLSWGNRGTIIMDISEAETVARDIIMAIKKDKDHYEALCDSVKVDKNIVFQ